MFVEWAMLSWSLRRKVALLQLSDSENIEVQCGLGYITLALVRFQLG